MAPLLEATFKVDQLQSLFECLNGQGYTLIGPKLESKVITYGPIKQASDLPIGWADEQDNGHYRITPREDKAYFGYNLGARSFKDFLFPPREKLYTMDNTGTVQNPSVKKEEKLALIGVRACELSAIQIQDKVFNTSFYPDPRYKARRDNAFIVGLNCHTTNKTCFCVSMNTGPEHTDGYDLSLSEIIDKDKHYFIAQAGSVAGKTVLEQLKTEPMSKTDHQAKDSMIEEVKAHMGRTLDTKNIKEKLYAAHNHPHWEKITERCINCANCTLVCPTCFCSKTEDESDLDQQQTTRTRTWDSCFSQDHSYIHGGYVRESASSRYRQWMTHKLASWHDQFDTSGCVGCGRCIAWCPVGIDITEEIQHFDEQNHEDNP